MNWQQPVEAVRVALGDGRGLLVAVRDLEGREGSAKETIAHAGLADDALDLVAEFSILLSLALGFFLGLKQFGERRQLAGHEFYTFPTWERLAGQDLSSLGLGYRDKYVEQLAQNVTDGRIDLHELTGMETEQARTYLKSIHGVGNKVADCVLLFGLHRVEAFPVDTWIRQVIDEHYGGKFPVEHYNGHAGIIQQFIFYYMQQHKGGKTT